MNSTVSLVLYFGVFFAIMYFLMIRPQQKQQKKRQALLNSLKVRDKVITVGGLHGKITKIKENSVLVQIADKVEVEVTRAGIASVENRDIDLDKEKKTDKDKNSKEVSDKEVKVVSEAGGHE